MRSTHISMNIVAVVAIWTAGATARQAAGDSIDPINQNRLVLAHVTTDCEGTTENQEMDAGFAPFDGLVQAFQICDAEGIFANSIAGQQSAIDASSIAASGNAFSAGESPLGLHAFASSFFEVTFDLPAASSFTVQGALGVSWGLPGGHQALVSLAGPGGQAIFAHSLVGTGGPPESVAIEESGVLPPGEYTLRASASISPADLLQMIPFPDASFDFTFQLPAPCPTDLNRDGAVDVLDLIDLLLCFGQPALGGCGPADINDDGAVNVLDLIELLLDFGTACP